LDVIVATNPLFPRPPIEQRLAWADLAVTEFDYTLVTSYEVMHATKAHPAYYREILTLIGRPPEACLMVGDHWEWDIARAAEVGISAYWITDHTEKPAAALPLVGQGSLKDLWAMVTAEGWTK
jgi:FMN phosphatase YigB (HAD superfamily)